MTEHTLAKWKERLREWRESGLSAEEFTAGKDYAAATLRWAVSQVGGETATRPASVASPRKTARRRGSAEKSAAEAVAPRFVPVRVRRLEPVVADVVVEVGGARIRVTRGVDVALLGDVVRALQGGHR